MAREHLGGAEKVVKLAHAQESGTAESGFVGCIGAGERSGV
jgi:hypothetical protein